MPLHIIRQDITRMRCDAIVNSTNEELVGYSGIDLAIHTRAGAELDAACRKLAPLEPGFARLTGGYALDCKYIIHTIGPVWQGGGCGEKAILRSCYLESLNLAREYGCESVAFPLISSGTYGYPRERVLHEAIQSIARFLQDHEMTVFLCVWDRDSYQLSRSLRQDIRSFVDDRCVEECVESDNRRKAAFRAARAAAPMHRREALRREGAGAAELGAPALPLREYLEQNRSDGFPAALFSLIDSRGIEDVACYKKANVDKKVFSKIKCNPAYKPSKQTAVAFAIALELDLDQTRELLATAGLALSHASVFDTIIEYFICQRNYNVFEINEALFDFEQPLLGA